MKTSVITLIITLISFTCHAQLKVNNLGAIQIGQACNPITSDDMPAMVTIGDDSTYIWSDFHLYNIGIQACKVPMFNKESIGLYAEVFPKPINGVTTSPISTGVWGISCASSTCNFGVVGALNGSYGAGIFGTTSASPSSQIIGSYAGFFDGNTYVDGNLTTYALYNLSDMRLKKNVTLLSQAANTRGNAIDHLQKLNVIEYNLVSAVKKEERYSNTTHFKNSEGSNEVELQRRHYGVSAQELKEIYPDLVLEGQDGYLAVNYVELVPILIRSIQELKTEIDEMKGMSKAMTRSISGETSDFSSVGKGNVLYQNSPNPFKGQTIIRFSLADDAQDAYICIYDMTGKQLRKFPISSGDEQITINSYELGEGMFLYSLIVNGQEIDTKKMVISK